MLELLTFIFAMVLGIIITIMLATSKNITDAIDCVESIFKTGRWSSR